MSVLRVYTYYYYDMYYDMDNDISIDYWTEFIQMVDGIEWLSEELMNRYKQRLLDGCFHTRFASS